MPTPIFTWLPDMGSEKSTEPNVKTTRFGDGYEQRVAVGINTMPAKWKLSFTRVRPVGQATGEGYEILAFLEARAGVEKFEWFSPDGKTNKYVCRKWSAKLTEAKIVVTCDFEQVFEY